MHQQSKDRNGIFMQLNIYIHPFKYLLMACHKIVITTIFLFTLVALKVKAQPGDTLVASTPEKQGVSSEGISNFLDAAAKSKIEFHSFMMLRHGKVIAKGWWNPYQASLKHTMYSCSKSFTATAVGFAVSENLLKLSDKVTSFFPHDLPDTVSNYLSQLTVKDVLSMAGGQEPDPTFIKVSSDSNWVKAFLSVPIVHKPGTTFLYNTLGTYMLSAIVQKVTGKKVIDYLTPRLFTPLGIKDMDWEVDPKGINVGGWGLRIKTEDMAKFGQLFLQKGKWNGKQVLPAAWVSEASTLKIIQHPQYTQAKRDSSDWEQGYCYQMWRCRHNAFRGDGAYGQFIIVMPDEDAVIAITAEAADMQDEINLVWQYLLPAMNRNIVPANNQTAELLKQKLSALSLHIPAKAMLPALADSFNKTYTLLPNQLQLQTISFTFSNTVAAIKLQRDTQIYPFVFGNGIWQQGLTALPGPSLLGSAKASYTGLPPLQIDGAFTWADNHTAVLTLRYIESPHTQKITCNFNGNKLSLIIENSLDFNNKKTTIEGSVKE